MITTKNIHLCRGKLSVQARGYWFSGGGEKGGFGYYPHLKDSNGLPVYPDTQLYGNLRMAADWFDCLNNEVSRELLKEIFGEDGNQHPSKLYITDLRVKPGKDSWSMDRFNVKTRIKISENTRTVEKKMLLQAELAFLNDIELESEIYLGYFDSDNRLEEAKSYLSECITLLGGIGAFRTRGSGKGGIKIDWLENESAVKERIEDITINKKNKVFFRSFNHFRNKRINPGVEQTLYSRKKITAYQLYAWLARNYMNIYGEWLSPEQLYSIEISDFFPAIDGILSIPAPMTVLKHESGEIIDTLNYSETEDEAGNFVRQKRKNVPPDTFFTYEESPKEVQYKVQKRIRNQMDDKFITLDEGGLFTQEFVHSGTVFGGYIHFPNIDAEYAQRIIKIIKTIHPTINGCIFNITGWEEVQEEEKQYGPVAVLEPMHYDNGILNYGNSSYIESGNRYRLDANIVKLETDLKYNTTLQRPHRPRIVISPGTVILQGENMDKCKPWSGFGKIISEGEPPDKGQSDRAQQNEVTSEYPDFKNVYEHLSRARQGFIRGLLNPRRDISEIKNILEDRKEKYEKNKEEHIVAFYQKLIEELDKGSDHFRNYVREILDALAWKTWKQGGKK